MHWGTPSLPSRTPSGPGVQQPRSAAKKQERLVRGLARWRRGGGGGKAEASRMAGRGLEDSEHERRLHRCLQHACPHFHHRRRWGRLSQHPRARLPWRHLPHHGQSVVGQGGVVGLRRDDGFQRHPSGSRLRCAGAVWRQPSGQRGASSGWCTPFVGTGLCAGETGRNKPLRRRWRRPVAPSHSCQKTQAGVCERSGGGAKAGGKRRGVCLRVCVCVVG